MHQFPLIFKNHIHGLLSQLKKKNLIKKLSLKKHKIQGSVLSYKH